MRLIYILHSKQYTDMVGFYAVHSTMKWGVFFLLITIGVYRSLFILLLSVHKKIFTNNGVGYYNKQYMNNWFCAKTWVYSIPALCGSGQWLVQRCFLCWWCLCTGHALLAVAPATPRTANAWSYAGSHVSQVGRLAPSHTDAVFLCPP